MKTAREKRIGWRAIDCIYTNTSLCVEINIFMHVILQVILSFNCPLGLKSITYTRRSTALVKVDNYIMNR